MVLRLVFLATISISSLVRADQSYLATLLHPRDPEVIRGTAFMTLHESLLSYTVEFDSDGVGPEPMVLTLGQLLVALPLTGNAVSIHEPGLPWPDPDWFPGLAVFWGEATLSDQQQEVLQSGDGYFGFGEWRGRIAAVPEPSSWILAAIALLGGVVLGQRHVRSRRAASRP